MGSTTLRVWARSALVASAVCLALTSAGWTQTPARPAALVFSGDGAAQDALADVAEVSKALGDQGLGFKVFAATGVSRDRIYELKGAFEAQLQPGAVAVIYYAGYGVRIGDIDYLVPAGANPSSAADLANVGFNLDALVNGARSHGADVLVLLDACRKKPEWDALGVQCLGSGARNRDHVYVVSARSAPGAGDSVSAFTKALAAELQPGASPLQVARNLKHSLGAEMVAADLPLGDQTPVIAAKQAVAAREPTPPTPSEPKPPTKAVGALDDQASSNRTVPEPPPATTTAEAGLALKELPPILNEATILYDDGDVAGARSKLSGWRARMDALSAQNPTNPGFHMAYGRIATMEGDYDAAVRAIETARRLPHGVSAEALNYYEGTAYLRAGKWDEAARLLEHAVGAFDQDSPEYRANSARLNVRLGEAYRRLGKPAEAAAKLSDSKQAAPNVDNDAASMQSALLAFDRGDFPNARSQADDVIRFREKTPTRSGLGEAVALKARAEFALDPSNEAAVWAVLDQALKQDPSSPEAQAFVQTLSREHPRMLAPDFRRQQPARYAFDLDIENAALSCWPTPDERDAYLNRIKRENASIITYTGQLNRYLADLSEKNERYRARGYNYYNVLMAEHGLWTDRELAAKARGDALVEWYRIAVMAPLCEGATPTRLGRPPTYDSRLPVDRPHTAVAVPDAVAPPSLKVASLALPEIRPADVARPPVMTEPAPEPTQVSAPAKVEKKPTRKVNTEPVRTPAEKRALVDGALAKGEAHVAQGNPDLAHEEFRRATAADPSNVDAESGMLMTRGLSHLRNQEADAAVADLEASVRRKPRPEALEALGRIYLAKELNGQAIDLFTQAITLKPHFSQALYGRAEARLARGVKLHDTGDLKEAMDDYRAALTAYGGDSPDVLMGLGRAQFYSADYPGALDSFNRALASRRVFPEAQYARSRTQFQLGAYRVALRDLADLGQQYDPYATSCSLGLTYMALGDTALMDKQNSEAVDFYTRAEAQIAIATRLRPGDVKLANLARHLGEIAQPGINGMLERKTQWGNIKFLKQTAASRPTATLTPADACKN
jgi:tetratricopeptide (TPR) repeat protein